MDDKQPLTEYNPQWVAKYGHPFRGWDAPRPTSKCLHCKGTGMADEANECGFCYADIVTLIRKDAKAQTLGQALGQAVELLEIVDELERRDAEIERLRAENNYLVNCLEHTASSIGEVLRAHAAWQEARRG